MKCSQGWGSLILENNMAGPISCCQGLDHVVHTGHPPSKYVDGGGEGDRATPEKGM